MRLEVRPETMPVEIFSLPTPYPVGSVNVYLIDAEPVTLIDAGVNTVDAESALKLHFSSLGMSIHSLSQVLVTHAHPDHYGLAPFLQEESGGVTYMGEQEVERITDNRSFWELARLLHEAGFPEEKLKSVANQERRLHLAHQMEKLKCKPVKDGDVFNFREFRLEAISLPGHTGGHLGFLEPESRTLFSGDALLPQTAPAPLLEPIVEPEGESPAQRRLSLKQYLDSLARLEALDLSIVYPGHGPVVTNPQDTIDTMREHYERRLHVVAGCLTSVPETAYQISGKLYPNLNGPEEMIAVSEVIAHLDLLVEGGLAAHQVCDEGVEYFFLSR